MMSPRLAALGCLAVTLIAAFSARADVSSGADTGGFERSAGQAATPVITAEQLAYFAELLGEPRPVVWRRLLADPTLVPFAVAAADARRDRKQSGKTRTVVGFSIVGVGGIAGYIVMLSAFDASCGYGYQYEVRSCDAWNGKRFLLGALIMAASTGLGLGIGIPGIISMARQSEVETAAVDRYQYPQMPRPAPYGAGATPVGYALKLPLLSLSF